jgi:hypothetical protein
MRNPRGGVLATEMGVAAEGERAGALGGLAEGLLKDDSCEAGVEDGVEVAGDGVKGDEGAEREGGRKGEDKFWIQEDAGEDVEGGGVGALVGECCGWGLERGAFAFVGLGEEDGVLEAVRGGVVGWGDEGPTGWGEGGVFGEGGDALVGEVEEGGEGGGGEFRA